MPVKTVLFGLVLGALLAACPQRPPQAPGNVIETFASTSTDLATSSALGVQRQHPFGTGGPPPSDGKPSARAGATTMFPNSPDRGSIPSTAKPAVNSKASTSTATAP